MYNCTPYINIPLLWLFLIFERKKKTLISVLKSQYGQRKMRTIGHWQGKLVYYYSFFVFWSVKRITIHDPVVLHILGQKYKLDLTCPSMIHKKQWAFLAFKKQNAPTQLINEIKVEKYKKKSKCWKI